MLHWGTPAKHPGQGPEYSLPIPPAHHRKESSDVRYNYDILYMMLIWVSFCMKGKMAVSCHFF